MKKKVLVGMSGGVDSAVAAALLQEQGYDVTGVTLKLWDGEAESGCCSLSDTEDARFVAQQLHIPFYVLNFKDLFRKAVVNPFIQAYLSGETPNPCIACNDHVKFAGMLQKAQELEIDYISTGHYVRKEVNSENNRFQLKKAADPKKDQSYVLYNLQQDQLHRTLFPLGGLLKTEVRDIAARRNLNVAHKRDSQDICFVGEGHYAEFIEKESGVLFPIGNFIDEEGRVVGQHKGLPYYTVGQRKHLGFSFGERMVVLAKSMESNTITVGKEKASFSNTAYVKNINWMKWVVSPESFFCKVRTRYSGDETDAEVNLIENGAAEIRFLNPKRAITPGQAAVFYDGDWVIGGGVIY